MEGVEEYFEEAETEREHNGCYYSAGTALTPVILGPLCGLRNVNRIHQWASTAHIAEYLSKHFKITGIPGYYRLLCLLKLIKPQPLNGCFVKWVQPFIPEDLKGLTVSFDGEDGGIRRSVEYRERADCGIRGNLCAAGRVCQEQ